MKLTSENVTSDKERELPWTNILKASKPTKVARSTILNTFGVNSWFGTSKL